MRFTKMLTAVAIAAVLALGAFAAFSYADDSGSSGSSGPMAGHNHMAATGPGGKAADLRVKLDRLLGEHALLAIDATRSGYDGDADFTRVAATLDQNSVELANTIGSVYGRKARNEFLNGSFKWRAHIRFFVDYTVALKKGDEAGQQRAVNNLKGYIGSFSGFLSKATGLPFTAVRASITQHVMQLKGQLDAYAAKDYAKAYRLQRTAYAHMFMTGDAIAGAIIKQQSR